jgi:hypothetical protein
MGTKLSPSFDEVWTALQHAEHYERVRAEVHSAIRAMADDVRRERLVALLQDGPEPIRAYTPAAREWFERDRIRRRQVA